MAADEISVRPDQVFAELKAVLDRLNDLPSPAEAGRTEGATSVDSPAVSEFASALRNLGLQLDRSVHLTAQTLMGLAGSIRDAVKYQVELDASFADDAEAITSMLDGLEQAYPEMVKTTPGSGGGRKLEML